MEQRTARSSLAFEGLDNAYTPPPYSLTNLARLSATARQNYRAVVCYRDGSGLASSLRSIYYERLDSPLGAMWTPQSQTDVAQQSLLLFM